VKKLVFFIMMVAVTFIFAEVKIVLKSGEVIKVDVDPSQIAQIVFVPQQNYILYEKTFNNLGDWKIGGRQEGVNKWEITNFKGEPCLHIHHEEFSEIIVYKWIKIPEGLSGKDIKVEIEMMGSARSEADSYSSFFSLAAVNIITNEQISVLDKWGNPSKGRIYWIRAGWVTSSYHKKHFLNGNYTEVRKFIELSPVHAINKFVFTIPAKYTSNASYLFVEFMAYGSGWPYDLKADLWVNHIKVYVSQ